MSVLLLGLKAEVVEHARAHASEIPDVDAYGGTGIEDLRAVFAKTHVDHVIMGAGLDLDVRLALVAEVFRLSKATSVHMMDRAHGEQSGPATGYGFLPFVTTIVRGLLAGRDTYRPGVATK
jgi:hypothetical protein